jgi:hypothetical protein
MCPVVRNRSNSGEHLPLAKPAAPISEGKLPPAGRRFPLQDLASEDLRTAMVDLVEFSRALSGLTGQSAGTEDHGATTLTCTEDGERLVGICDGPDQASRCPWADAEGRLPYTGYPGYKRVDVQSGGRRNCLPAGGLGPCFAGPRGVKPQPDRLTG